MILNRDFFTFSSIFLHFVSNFHVKSIEIPQKMYITQSNKNHSLREERNTCIYAIFFSSPVPFYFSPVERAKHRLIQKKKRRSCRNMHRPIHKYYDRRCSKHHDSAHIEHAKWMHCRWRRFHIHRWRKGTRYRFWLPVHRRHLDSRSTRLRLSGNRTGRWQERKPFSSMESSPRIPVYQRIHCTRRSKLRHTQWLLWHFRKLPIYWRQQP